MLEDDVKVCIGNKSIKDINDILMRNTLIPFKCLLGHRRGKHFDGNQPRVWRCPFCHRDGVVEVLDIENLRIRIPRRPHSYLKVWREVPFIRLSLDYLRSSDRILLIIRGAVSFLARPDRTVPQGQIPTRRAGALELLIRSIMRRCLALCLAEIDSRESSGLWIHVVLGTSTMWEREVGYRSIVKSGGTKSERKVWKGMGKRRNSPHPGGGGWSCWGCELA